MTLEILEKELLKISDQERIELFERVMNVSGDRKISNAQKQEILRRKKMLNEGKVELKDHIDFVAEVKSKYGYSD